MVHLGLAEDDGPSSEAAAEENSKSSSNEKQTLKNDNDLVNTNDSNTNNSTTTTTTTSTQIQQQQQQQLIIPKEDPKSIPNDETAFTNTPHFSINNPFHRSLRDLDLSYRCTICYQLYNVPVSLYPCLHSFCSLCIRTNLRSQYTGMKRKAECPLCHVNLLTNGNGSGGGGGYEKSILQNKALENMVDLYKDRVRGTLRESLVRLDVLEWKEKKGALMMMGSGSSMMMAADNNADADPKQQLEEQKDEPSLQSASKRARRSTANYQREYSNESSDNDDDEKDDDEEATYSDATATPAVASASAAAAATTASFNHLTKQQQQHQSSSPRKRKPTVSYHGLKRKKLIELCQREGLGINGTDQDLKQRHADFIMLYNAQCDSQHPMSENEVAQEIMKQEKCRKRESIEAIQNGSSNHSTYMKRLADNMTSGSGKVTTGSKKVDEEMGNSFKSMIAIIKAKKNGETVDTSMPSCIRSAMVAENDHFESKPSATTMTASAGGSTRDVAAVAPSKPKSDISRATPSKKSMRSTSSSATTTAATTTTRATSKQQSQKTTSSSSTSSAKKSSTKNSTTTSGMWICQACTFENHKFIAANALCEMCNTRRPEKENTMNEVIAIDC